MESLSTGERKIKLKTQGFRVFLHNFQFTIQYLSSPFEAIHSKWTPSQKHVIVMTGDLVKAYQSLYQYKSS